MLSLDLRTRRNTERKFSVAPLARLINKGMFKEDQFKTLKPGSISRCKSAIGLANKFLSIIDNACISSSYLFNISFKSLIFLV